MTKHPTKRRVAIDNIIHDYNAPYLRDALARFAVRVKNPNLNETQIERQAVNITMPSSSLAVYHRAKIWLGDAQHSRLSSDEFDSIYVEPDRKDKHGRIVSGRFDTVLINDGNGQYIGMNGKAVLTVYFFHLYCFYRLSHWTSPCYIQLARR